MNFEPTAQMKELREVVTRFARSLNGSNPEVEPAFTRERWRACGEQGLLGLCVPAQYGGAGLDALTAAYVLETLGRECDDLGLAFSISAHQFACVMPILHFGTEAQKERWLPKLCSGEWIAAHAITEPEGGSDTLHPKTKAERKGDHYVLNGNKCFSTNAPVADLFLVHAATLPGGGFLGLTAFAVENGTPGLRVGQPYSKIGLRGSPTADVYLEDCLVPEAQRIGKEGSGASLFTDSMNWERTLLFAAFLGAMDRQVERTVEYAKERRQFDTPIGTFQAVSHKIVDMRMRVESARLMLYRAAWSIERDGLDTIAPAMAKIAVSEGCVQIGLDAIQMHGGLGVLTGPIERLLRDALPSRIFSGTSEIQRNNIARAMGLGDALRPRATRKRVEK